MRKVAAAVVGLLAGLGLAFGSGQPAGATCTGHVDLWVTFSAPVAASVKGEYTLEMKWGAHTLPGGYPETTFVGYPRWTVTVGQGATIIAAPEAYPAPFTAHHAVMKFPNSVRPTEYRVAHFTLRRDPAGAGAKVSVRAFMDIWAPSYCAVEYRPSDNTAYANLPAQLTAPPATPRPTPSPTAPAIKASPTPTPPAPRPSRSPSPVATLPARTASASPSPPVVAAPAVQPVASTSSSSFPVVPVVGGALLVALLAGGGWVLVRRRP